MAAKCMGQKESYEGCYQDKSWDLHMDCDLVNSVVSMLNFLIWVIVLRSCDRMPLFLSSQKDEIYWGKKKDRNCSLGLEGLTFAIMSLAVCLLYSCPSLTLGEAWRMLTIGTGVFFEQQ